MERVAFIMQSKEGCVEEYKRRHDAIWPELSRLIKSGGISDYSIFLEAFNNLIGCVVCPVKKVEGVLSPLFGAG
jgi:L-rhamnose mutarotase